MEELVGRTPHSLAMAMLMRNHVLQTLGRAPRPLNEFGLEPLLADLPPAHGNKYRRRDLIAAYVAAWARSQHEQPGYAARPEDQEFAHDLLDWLTLHEAMLIGEVIPQLYTYLRNNPGAPERTEFAHTLVDEYQDLNRAEQEVVSLLGSAGHICILGDDYQSIYSFKHAHPAGIREAERRAQDLRADLVKRGVHPDVLQFCEAELIADNYFHAVHEATKSIAVKLRARTGLTAERLLTNVWAAISRCLQLTQSKPKAKRVNGAGLSTC